MKLLYSNKSEIFNIHESGIPYLSFRSLDELGVPNLYSTRYRADGQSGLRLLCMPRDNYEEIGAEVVRNTSELLAALGSSLDMACMTNQKHTGIVKTVTAENLYCMGRPSFEEPVDGLVTNLPGIALIACGADCPPVYIADPVRKAIGLVHAGWKGTLARIPAVAIEKMATEFGCSPENMYAGIGPGICRECYEMGDEVQEMFAEQWGSEAAEKLFERYPAGDENGNEILGGKCHLDLRTANKMTLESAGIPAEHIAVSNVCTRCNVEHFYSYRAHRMENEQEAMLVNSFGDKFGGE